MMAAPASADTEVGEHISVDTTWDIAGSPYIVTGDITIYNTTGSTPTLTIDPGVEVRFKNHTGLHVGWYSSYPGALNADGDSSNRILFTANDSKTNGVWDGIYFYDRSNDSLCLLNNCIIEYGGYSYNANVYLASASPTITNCTIQNSSMYGIYCADGSSPTMSNNEISDNDGYPVGIYANYVPAIGSGNTFSGNTNNAIIVWGDVVSENARWIDQGVPYVIWGTVWVYKGGSELVVLTLDPGVEMKFRKSGGYLYLGGGSATNPGALVAEGTPSDQIVFTSNLNFGNPKNSRSHSIIPQIPKYRRPNLTQNHYQQTPRNIPNFALIPRCMGKAPASHCTAAPRFLRF